MSGSNILDVLSHPVAADPEFYRKGLDNLNALRDTQAKQAIADITQQAIGPDGQVDPAKFNLLISQNPKAAWGGLAAMQAQGTAQGQQGVGQQEEVAGHRARLSQMYGIMAPLAAKGGPISLSDIQNAANQAHLSPTEAAQIGQDVNAEGGGDPSHDYSGWLKGRMTSNLTSQEQIARTTPDYRFHNIGGRLVPIDMNSQTNPNPGSLITTLSPGEASRIVDVQLGDGRTQQMPLSDAITKLSTNPAMRILGPTTGGGGSGGSGSLNAAGDSATRKAAEGGPPAPNTPAAAVAQRTHDFWISQGYNEAQVAGILAGGPGSESDFSPTAGGDKVNGVPTSIGLYQHHGERLDGMRKFFNLGPGQMPTEQQQNQYAAWEISPQGPKAAVGAALKAARTPAEAATIWTRDFGVPADKSEILRRANGAQRFEGIYAGQPGQPQGAAGVPSAPPAGPPGVQMGGAPPPPPGGSAGPYTGGGIGAALAPGGGANPVVVRGTPLPSGKLSGDVGAMVQGMQLARANPLQSRGGAMVAGPGAPSGNHPLVSSVEPPPQPGWGSAVGSYSGGPGAPTPAARPVVPAPAPVQPPAATSPPAPIIGRSAPLGTAERVTADIGAYTKDSAANGIHQNNINTLQNAYRALQLADTGPGTQNLQAARAFLQSFGIATSATGDQATQWAEAHKYLMDYARTQGGIGGTDLQLLASKESNASTDIPKPAALAVVRNNIARERMSMAQVLEASGPTGYVDHTKTFLPSQDLRAYQADIMPPQELKQIEALQKTNPKAFEKFQKSLDIAVSHGLISMEDIAAQNKRIRVLGP